MSDQSQGDQPREQKISVVVSDDVKYGEYANFLVVSHSAHEFTLDFCQLLPSSEPDRRNADVVQRIRIAPTMVARVIQALNTNLNAYEEKYGSVKVIG